MNIIDNINKYKWLYNNVNLKYIEPFTVNLTSFLFFLLLFVKW